MLQDHNDANAACHTSAMAHCRNATFAVDTGKNASMLEVSTVWKLSTMPSTNEPTGGAWTFRGVTSPNTTQVPDQYLDELLPLLTGAELKVLLYITRRTFGFKKAADNIALSQMLNGITTNDGRVLDHGVGLAKNTLLKAINSLEAKQIIRTQRRASVERGYEPTTYQLNIAANSDTQPTPLPLAQKVNKGLGAKRSPSPWRKNVAIQQTVKQQTEYSNSNDRNLADPEVEKAVQPAHSADIPTRSASPSWPKRAWDQLPDEPNDGQPASKPTGPVQVIGTLFRPPATRRSTPDEERLAIGGDLELIAAKLGDKAPPRASLTRAMRLYRDAEISLVSFRQLLFDASAVAQDARARNRMAYFFRVIEDRLGLRGEATAHASKGAA